MIWSIPTMWQFPEFFLMFLPMTSHIKVDFQNSRHTLGVVGSGEGVVYLTSPGRPTEIGLQLGKACYPCSR